MKIFEISVFGFSIGPTYYGILYVISFLIGFLYFRFQHILPKDKHEDFLLYTLIGVILWGRIGYILFYNPWYYFFHPLEIFFLHKWGMSFHGGVIWVALSTYFFSKKYALSYLLLTDKLSIVWCIGIFLWRIGNYINKELLGFPYNGPLAVYVDGTGYFPSPLVEALTEWVLLGIILFFIEKNNKMPWKTTAFFLIGYGVFRSIIEYTLRAPDKHMGYVIGNISMGAILSFMMILGGMILALCIFRSPYFFKK